MKLNDTKICSKCEADKSLNEYSKFRGGLRNVCKTCVKIYDQERYKNSKDKLKQQVKDYCKNNKYKVLLSKKKYDLKNRTSKNIYVINRRKIDELYRLKCNVRSLIGASLRNNNYKKDTKTQNILGCPFEDFKLYLESKFELWMSWDNYGKYNGQLNFGWDIDHIIPVSSSKTKEELIKLNHYTNLQPLCSYINRDIKNKKTTYFI